MNSFLNTDIPSRAEQLKERKLLIHHARKLINELSGQARYHFKNAHEDLDSGIILSRRNELAVIAFRNETTHSVEAMLLEGRSQIEKAISHNQFQTA